MIIQFELDFIGMTQLRSNQAPPNLVNLHHQSFVELQSLLCTAHVKLA